jgi:hypothetical protein
MENGELRLKNFVFLHLIEKIRRILTLILNSPLSTLHSSNSPLFKLSTLQAPNLLKTADKNKK